MSTLKQAADSRVQEVSFQKKNLVVSLKDGRAISAPLIWYPRLLNATKAQRENWQVCGGGYGIHWPDIDEDLSTEGLLRGLPAPHWNEASKPPTTLGKKRSKPLLKSA